MCYWVGTKEVRNEMLRRLEKQPDDEIAQLFYKTFVGSSNLSFMEHWVAIGKANPVLSVLIIDQQRRLHYQNMQWGFNWHYTDPKTGRHYDRELINSTCEKVFFVHKDDIYHRRCVIPIDGYWEFFHFSGQVYPYFLHPSEGIFYAAGVWREDTDEETGEIRSMFSIITTPPNPMAEKLHNNPKSPNGSRMLLLLHPDKVMHYLNPEATTDEIKELFMPYPEDMMKAYPTVRFLKKEFADKLDTDVVRKRIDYPELFFA